MIYGFAIFESVMEYGSKLPEKQDMRLKLAYPLDQVQFAELVGVTDTLTKYAGGEKIPNRLIRNVLNLDYGWLANYFEKDVLRYVEKGRLPVMMLALRDIIASDSSIPPTDEVDPVRQRTKAEFIKETEFEPQKVLAGLYVYAATRIDENCIKAEIDSINGEFFTKYESQREVVKIIHADASSVKSTVTESDIDTINALLARCNIELEPVQKPVRADDKEKGYINELFLAYGDRLGKIIRGSKDLPTDYRTDMEMQRDSFYAAETVRIQGHNALAFIKPTEFDELKEEMFTGIWDAYNDDYKDGCARMKAVLKQAGAVICTKSLLSKTNWITVPVRKGVCHMLAGENKLRWVKHHG